MTATVDTKKASSKKKTKVEPQDLGLIPLTEKNQVFGISLPSTAKGVIVKYDADEDGYSEDSPAILITVSLPSQKMELLIGDKYFSKHKTAKKAMEEYEKCKVKVPPTLFCMGLVDIPNKNNIREMIASYYIFVHNQKKKDTIEGFPYGISNVFSDGGICFGNHNPISLKEANNTFWNSPFNLELSDEHDVDDFDSFDEENDDFTAKQYMKFYSKQIKDAPWDDLKDFICGEKFWAMPGTSDAILLTNNTTLLDKMPRDFWRKHREGPLLIAKVTKLETEWLCESGGFKFRLPLEGLTLSINKKKKRDAV